MKIVPRKRKGKKQKRLKDSIEKEIGLIGLKEEDGKDRNKGRQLVHFQADP